MATNVGNKLYAWTTESTTQNFPKTFYTDTENPTTSSKIYDSNGTELDIHDFTTKPSVEITSATSSSITIYYGTSG